MIYALLAILLLGLLVLLYVAFAPGPRRRRAFTRATKLLDQGEWSPALDILRELQGARHSAAWEARLRHAEGECHQQAADEALREGDYEEALRRLLLAAPLQELDEDEQRQRIVEAMLAETRKLFAAGQEPKHTEAVLALLVRLFTLQPNVPEATFWQALCSVRAGELEAALATMTALQETVGRQYIDPAFYAGVLLHRLGRPQEALRYLSEANRLDATCPFVTWQMGVSLVAADGDSAVAMRALQRALGNRGFALWQQAPARAWVEAFPEGKSFVRRLASKHRFVCPLLGADLGVIVRQGQLALAQALYRQDRFAESADLYAKLLQDSPPTVLLLRGYGLALARQGQYDQAYKQLRIALDQEEGPKGPFTAGYLALCGALGKPTNPDDKPRNVTWAIRLLARYPVPHNAEWAGIISAVMAEARSLGLPLSEDDQLLLCDTLASVEAILPRDAEGYAHLAATFPDALVPIHSWLYARAATVHRVSSPADMVLFGRAFQTADAARPWFARHEWDFAEVEYRFLERAAELAPGRFPEVLGADYPVTGERFLLDRSRAEEEAKRADNAWAAVEVLLRLSPGNLPAHDRLACLYYRGGAMDSAVGLLSNWQRLAPHDHWPLVRQAIIEQERGNAERRAEAIDRALGLTHGPTRAEVAYLGARLALRDSVPVWKGEAKPEEHPALAHSVTLLESCLREGPDHVEALWCLAAVRSVQGDREALAALAPRMDRPQVSDGRFHYLGAVCHLAARDYRRAIELGKRAGEVDPALAVEGQFVTAWAHVHLNEPEAAREALLGVAGDDTSPSAPFARAMLGQLDLARGAYDEAITWWGRLDQKRRAAWQLGGPLEQTILLSGLLALEEGRYDQAADRFREGGRLGLRDKRLGGLMVLSLVKAGQRLLFGSE